MLRLTTLAVLTMLPIAARAQAPVEKVSWRVVCIKGPCAPLPAGSIDGRYSERATCERMKDSATDGSKWACWPVKVERANSP